MNLLLLRIVQAQETAPETAPIVAQTGRALYDLLDKVIAGWLFSLAMVLSIIFLIVAGFNYITSQGNAEKVKAAGQMVTYAVVGIVVAILAKAIPLVIESILGVGTRSF